MKYLALACSFLFLLPLTGFGQVKQVTEWNLKVKKVNATTYDLTADVAIEDGWYLYSQFLAPDEGPIPTSFEFEKGVKQLTKREEGNKHEIFDPIFEMHLVKFSKNATFTSRVEVPAGAKTLSGSYTFMTCDETKCLPPIQQKFTVDLL
ncbi:MAG: protein-disulfide reductase DsbD N-terminal domain-containing protein [Saprospiraceae bacterium]|nr:protein-disulfide reductase DsbD N-terminal domain-containing protein [Saprospiraceae bacterium]